MLNVVESLARWTAGLTSRSSTELFLAVLIDFHVHFHILFALCIFIVFLFGSSRSFTWVRPAIERSELLPVYKLLVFL